MKITGLDPCVKKEVKLIQRRLDLEDKLKEDGWVLVRRVDQQPSIIKGEIAITGYAFWTNGEVNGGHSVSVPYPGIKKGAYLAALKIINENPVLYAFKLGENTDPQTKQTTRTFVDLTRQQRN